MSFRIIDNKKIEMTEDEWGLYVKICQSYTDLQNKGEDLFIDLFEADDNGIITFLKPPSKRRSTLEVFLFLMSLMQHQHLRLMHAQIDEACSSLKQKVKGK